MLKSNFVTNSFVILRFKILLRLLITILLFCSVCLQAQNNPIIDSLTKVYDLASTDQSKVKIIRDLAHAYQNVNKKKAQEFAQQGLELAKKIGDTKTEISCILELATLDRNSGNFVLALSKLKNGLQLAQNKNDTTSVINSYIAIGDVYSVLLNYDKAIQYYDHAIDLSEKSQDQKTLITSLTRKGNRFMDKGRALNDSMLFMKAIAIYQNAEKKSSKDATSKNYINSIVSLADAYNILGHNTGNTHHLYKSLNYSMNSLRLAQRIYSKEYEALSYLNLGEVYLSLNKEIKAIHYFELAEKIYSEIGNKGWLLNTNTFLAKSYYSLHLYDKASQYINRSIVLAKEQGQAKYLRDNYQLLADIYSKQGDFEKAYWYHKLYNDNKDSVLNETTSFNISRIQAELDLERKDKEIELLTKNTEIQSQKISVQTTQRNFLIAGLIILIFVLLITIYLYRQKKKVTQEIFNAKVLAETAKEAQEQFLANTSHEIRTPMNGIIGMTNHLMETGLDSQQKEYVSVIKESSNNLLALINELLDLSKIMAKKIVFDNKPFEIREIIKSLVRLLEFRTKEKNIKIIFDIDSRIPLSITGDAVRLKQILLNLVENAVKFTHNGEVKIIVRLLEEVDDSVNLEFKIEDTGIGIPENKLNAIFENFTQVNSKTTRKYSGTGLGLPITKQLVEQQDGTISVISKLNVGSIFSFTLRFKKVITNSAESNHHHFNFSVFPKADLEGMHVLIVDDNKINQQVASLTLQKWNAQTVVSNSAMDAFDLLDKHHFDLILMDVTMPEIDGFEATGKIRKHSDPRIANLPIIAITAAAFIADKNKCIEAGMNDYISKPFDPTDLLNKIHKLLPATSNNQKKLELCDLTLLKDRAAGDSGFIKEILESYTQEMPLYIAEMELFLNKKDWQEVSKQAHKMKSPIALMGATKLKELYAKIEIEATLNKDHESLIKQIRIAQKQCLKTVDELKRELDNIKV